MAKPVPPVEYKSTHEPANKAFKRRHVHARKAEQGLTRKRLQPEFSGKQCDTELDETDQQGPEIPAGGIGRLAARKGPLPDKEHAGSDDHQDDRYGHEDVNV